MSRLNKGDIVNNIAEQVDLTKREATSVVNTVFATIEESLANGNSVTFTGFGTFKVRERAARKGRNMATGEPMDIPAKNVPVFKAGKHLKDAVL